ncbi:MAG: ATP-dependent DNA helicase RecG [Bacilli bacterium]|nr:ATP-dependent DNA helicase RecG [Bacilli bacterium]MDD4808501.1 ATP-dependent DNA helicase RecG [Bacilli bacterium]
MKELNELKGVGPKTLNLLNKLGIDDNIDLVTYYPFRYEVLKRSDIYQLNQDDKIIIDGVVENIPSLFRFKNKKDVMNFHFNTGEILVKVTIYNRGFLKSKLNPGTNLTIIGKYDKLHNTIIANDLRFELLGEEIKIEPIYHSTYGLSSKQIGAYINQLLDEELVVKSYVPDYLIDKYKFISKEESIKIIHRPTEQNKLKQAINHLKYEELFMFMLKMNNLKENKNNKIGLKRNISFDKVTEFIKELSFKLTKDQEISVKEIYDDLISSKRMNRLLQGDVGSGKTVVSMIAMYLNYLSGYQSALMVPTEILANQHFINALELFKSYDLKIELLKGKMKVTEKKQIYEGLENGEIDIIIGTHALIQEEVKYYNLGLVITDEQHRFGVNQRSNLKNKGITPDVLYMSATPIPRTYALTLYGDMDISNIKTMPEGRKEVITYLKHNDEIKDVLNLMYQELKNNHQVYVIAPLIEESDKIDLENVYELENKMKKAFGKLYSIGVLHGKMTNQEKGSIMNDFRNNKIQILISTTVIEVGVDVENATVMVIFDSYRFGLSALHQLRGRVGRSHLQSYCVLISNQDAERLKVLTKTNDGFKVSEEDFRLRGSGDLFGVRQSGEMAFKMADIKQDFKMLLKAKEDSLEFIKSHNYHEPHYKFIKDRIETTNNLD